MTAQPDAKPYGGRASASGEGAPRPLIICRSCALHTVATARLDFEDEPGRIEIRDSRDAPRRPGTGIADNGLRVAEARRPRILHRPHSIERRVADAEVPCHHPDILSRGSGQSGDEAPDRKERADRGRG